MAVINQFMVEALDAVDRQLRARQDQTSAVSQTPPNPNAPTDPATPMSTMTTTPNQQITGGPTSSPLLFFVALGFGVVFTNLWIIVGVKYCFRYSARNRQLRNGEDMDNIGLDQMQSRPRRRREKKLMTMDEVNERFPLMKYKSWVVSRAREGLPTSGGVSVPPSRAQSIRNDEAPALSSPIETMDSLGQQPKPLTPVNTSTDLKDQLDHEEKQVSEKDTLSPNYDDSDAKENYNPPEVHVDPSSENPAPHSSDDEDEDEDEHRSTVIPPELRASPGDACAICIDTLEEEDEVRGLSCGHAFHAGCLDPWLTSRRACCPLCKADYHVPKPRPEGDNTEPDRVGRRRINRDVNPIYSQSLWSSIFSSTRRTTFHHSNQTVEPSRGGSSHPSRNTSTHVHGALPETASHPSRSTSTLAHGALSETASHPLRSLNIPFFTVPIRSLHMPHNRFLRRNRETAVAEPSSNTQVSLSQLEAGNTTNR
ncbi:hypothetical protein K3495_g8380 [Podosphaera aphanis]|nr:hypothetical protein K3495_g8380 [Podosphaera aphanis]